MKAKILEKVEVLDEAQQKITLDFLENLTKQIELPEIFKAKLEEIGNNPIDEHKIAKAKEEILQEQEAGIAEPMEFNLDILRAIYTPEELDELAKEHNFDIVEFATFGREVHDKVFNLNTLVDGKLVYKEIASQNDLAPIAYTKKRELRTIIWAMQKIATKIQKAETIEEIDTLSKEAEILRVELDKKIDAAHNLNTNSMTDWEKELLKAKMIAHAFDNYMPPMGKK